MPWWLIAYFGINLVIATFCTVVTWKDGWFDRLVDRAGEHIYKTNWLALILVFVGLLLFGLPVIIAGMIVLTFEG